jgi:hypothetical protein
MLQDFISLSRVIEFDALHAFARPVEKELGGDFADAVPVRADFDIKQTVEAKRKVAGHVLEMNSAGTGCLLFSSRMTISTWAASAGATSPTNIC